MNAVFLSLSASPSSPKGKEADFEQKMLKLLCVGSTFPTC